MIRRRAAWWVAPLLVAVAARLVYRFGADEPLLYSHPYNYFHGALSIVENRDPWGYVLRSDDWHRWLGPWTIAPLYYLFVASIFALGGAHLLPVQLTQLGLDSGVAVLVAWLGRRVSPRRGVWAGVAYALNFHAIEQSGSTLTENLHTPLLVASLCLLVAEASPDEPPAPVRWGKLLLGGWLLGLSALARAVSTAFVPIVMLWRWHLGGRRGLGAAVVLGLGSAAAVLPWTARNAVFIGDFVPVETNGVYNFYDDNAFVEGAARAGQEQRIASEPTPAGQRARATRLALRGIARNPGAFVEKAWRNLLHFIRPDGLHNLLAVEEPMPPWRHAALLLLDDAIVLPTVILFVVFLAAGPRTPARGLMGLWTAYYLLMVVVVFHNEIRYRSTLLPFALAGAAAGVDVLADRAGRRRTAAKASLLIASGLVVLVAVPYALPAWRAVRSTLALRGLEAEVARGDLAAASDRAQRAAALDPVAARPWLVYGAAVARADRWDVALEAYGRARERKAHVWLPTVVMPMLLREAGRDAEAETAVEAANAFSWNVDPWLALEAAWRALPPPHTDDVVLGGGDYGSARGFSNPHRGYRWTGRAAWFRLRPRTAARAYDVTLWMGSPEPSPLAHPAVTVRAEGTPPVRLVLDREIAPYVVAVPAPEGLVALRLDAPTWNADREPAEQGIRIDRVVATPRR